MEERLINELKEMMNDSIIRADEIDRLYDEDKLSTSEHNTQWMWEKGYQQAVRRLLKEFGG